MKSKQLHQRLHHIEPHSNLFIFKHVKIQNAIDKKYIFFGTMPFHPWAILAT
jgi:hypothetical protein